MELELPGAFMGACGGGERRRAEALHEYCAVAALEQLQSQCRHTLEMSPVLSPEGGAVLLGLLQVCEHLQQHV